MRVAYLKFNDKVVIWNFGTKHISHIVLELDSNWHL